MRTGYQTHPQAFTRLFGKAEFIEIFASAVNLRRSQNRVKLPVEGSDVTIRILIPLIGLLAIGLAWAAMSSSDADPATHPASQVESATRPPPISPDLAAENAGRQPAPSTKTSGIGKTGPAPAGAAIFPDGTWLSPLNDVEKAPDFPGFTPGVPFSPVVKIYHSAETGLDYYQHADGSHSTTYRALHQEGQKSYYAATWIVANPKDPLPLKSRR